MLRVIQKAMGGCVKIYYTHEPLGEDTGPYAANLGPNVTGYWGGRLAEELRLSGKVNWEDYMSLVRNRNPQTQERLTQRDRGDRVPGHDVTICCPKGPAIMYFAGVDPGIRECHDIAVRHTMAEIELNTYTRVRKGGQDTNRHTGNLVWAEFRHQTARPVDGVADMLLHTHAFVFNVTRDHEETMYKAVQFGLHRAAADYYEAVYVTRLAGLLEQRGYELEWNGRYFDLQRLPQGLVAKFSRRQEEIRDLARREDIWEPEKVAALAAKTRTGKGRGLAGEALRENWRQRVSEQELNGLVEIARAAANRATRPSDARQVQDEGNTRTTSEPGADVTVQGTSNGIVPGAPAGSAVSSQLSTRPTDTDRSSASFGSCDHTKGRPGEDRVGAGPQDSPGRENDSGRRDGTDREGRGRQPGEDDAHRKGSDRRGRGGVADNGHGPGENSEAGPQGWHTGASARPSRAARDLIGQAKGKAFERSSVVPERTLLCDALRLGRGKVGPAELRAVLDEEVRRGDIIRKPRKGMPCITTREVLAEEQRMVALVEHKLGSFKPLLAKRLDGRAYGLKASQLEVFDQLLGSRNFVTVLDAVSGTGKSSLMGAVQQAFEEHLLRSAAVSAVGLPSVVALAPTTKAAHEVLPRHGFKDGDTVAKFLTDASLQAKAMAAGFVWIDEANQMGTRLTIDTLEKCLSLGVRVFMTGDSRQHGSVARGSVLRTIESHSKVGVSTLGEILRQKGLYKEAVSALATGDVTRGFGILEKMSALREERDPWGAAAKDYVDSVSSGVRTTLIAPSRKEVDLLNTRVRDERKSRGQLRSEKTFEQLRSLGSTVEERSHTGYYRPGQVIRFHQNAVGFQAGSRWNVRGVDPFGNIVVTSEQGIKGVPLMWASRFDVCERSEISLAKGELVRLTARCRAYGQNEDLFNKATGRTATPTHKMANGSEHRIKGFARDGGIKLDNGLVLPRDFGFIEYGYAGTSYRLQGSGSTRAVLCATKISGRAVNLEQCYTSVSRGESSVAVYTDSKLALREASSRSSVGPSAMDLVSGRDEEPAGRRRGGNERSSEQRQDRGRDDTGKERGRERE